MQPVNQADVEAAIASEHYFTAADAIDGAATPVAFEFYNPDTGHAIVDYSEHTYVGHLSRENGYVPLPLVKKSLVAETPLALLTFCVLVLRNGHTVTGEAHCQNPAKFDAQIGRTEARKDAINKLWPMVVYARRGEAAAAAVDPEAAADVQDAS